MVQRNLSVKFGTEGFSEVANQIKSAANTFQTALKAAQDAGKKAAEAARQAAAGGDAKGLATALKQQENAAKAASRAIAASYRELGIKSSESINRLRAQAVSAFEAIKASGTASARDIAAAQAALNRRLSELDDQLQGVTRTSTNLGANLKLALTGAVVGLTASLAALGKTSLDAGANFEQFRITLETFLASKDRADQLIKQIANFAATTPFELPEIQKASRSLLAFNFEAGQVIPTLKRIGDVAAGVSQPINDITLIYGKARIAGRLFAEDINQLTERGIPIITELAKQFGVTESEVRKLVESGKVNFSNLEQAFVSLTSEGGKFFNLMQAQSQSTSGRLSNLADRFTALKVQIFDAFQPQINAAIDAVSNNLGLLQGATQKVIDAFKFLAQNGNTVIAVLAALGTALAVRAAVTALTAAITALAAAFTAAGGAAGILNTALTALTNPANLAAVGIGVLIGAIVKFTSDARQARAEAVALSDALGVLATKSSNQALIDLDRQEANAKSQLQQIDNNIAILKREIANYNPYTAGFSGKTLDRLQADLRQQQAERADVVRGLQGVGTTRAKIENNILESRRAGPPVPPGFGQRPARPTTATTTTTGTAKTPKGRVVRVSSQNEAEQRTQQAIQNRFTELDRFEDDRRSLVLTEYDQNKLEIEKELLSADEDRKRLLEDELKLLGIEYETTIKQLELTIQLAKAGDTITILQAQRRKLSEAEAKQLEEARYQQGRLTRDIELAESSRQREVELLQESIRVYEEKYQQQQDREQRLARLQRLTSRNSAIANLRSQVGDVTSGVLSANAPEPVRQLNQQRVQYENNLIQLLELLKQAEEYGDIESINRIKTTIDTLTKSREESLRIQIQTLETQTKLGELTGEELVKFQQLTELQQEFDDRRVQIQALLGEAQANGYTEAVAALEDLLIRTDKLQKKQEEQIKSQFDFIRQISATVRESAAQATEQALTDLFTLSKSLGDIFRDFATSILRSLAQLAAQAATKAIFRAIGIGFADGGLVRGAGTSRSDSIPARLSNGEFVMTADAVKYWGVGFLDSLNALRSPNVAYAGLTSGGNVGVSRNPVIINNITTPDANSFRRSESQIGRDAAEQLRRSMQRNG